MIQIEYLPIVLTGIGIIVSILYYASVLRNQNKTRQAQLFMQIYEKWYDPTFSRNTAELRSWEWEDVEEFDRKYGPDVNPEGYSKFLSYIRFFQGVGVLLQQGLIDVSLVGEMMPATVISAYQRYELILRDHRSRNQETRRLWEPVEYLYNEVLKYEEQQVKKENSI